MESRLPITEVNVINILKNKTELINSIQDRIYNFRKDISDTDEIIEMVSLSSKELSDMPGGGGKKDLWNTYEKYRRQLELRQKEYADSLYHLIMQEDRIYRVWNSFLLLDEPYYGIVKRLYTEKELYDTVQKESGYSLQVFNKYRKRAIKSIIDIYNSEITDENLQQMSCREKNIQSEGKSHTEGMEQYSISDYI